MCVYMSIISILGLTLFIEYAFSREKELNNKSVLLVDILFNPFATGYKLLCGWKDMNTLNVSLYVVVQNF